MAIGNLAHCAMFGVKGCTALGCILFCVLHLVDKEIAYARSAALIQCVVFQSLAKAHYEGGHFFVWSGQLPSIMVLFIGISITCFIYGQFKYEVEEVYWLPLITQDLESKFVRPNLRACYKFFVISMIGVAIQTFVGIACLIDFVRPWDSACAVSFLSPFRSYHIITQDLESKVVRPTLRACYKFFVFSMIGFVIQTFAGIACLIDFVPPWDSACAVSFPSPFCSYHSCSRIGIFITFFIYGQFKDEVEDVYSLPLTTQNLESKCVRLTQWDCYKFFVLSMIGFVIQAFVGVACSMDLVRSWDSACAVSFPSLYRRYHIMFQISWFFVGWVGTTIVFFPRFYKRNLSAGMP